MMIALCQTGTFNVSSVAHLRVGHTHEDVDSIFSIVTSIMRSAQNIETPRDLQRLIVDRVGPVFTRKALDFDLEILDVATWSKNL